jgi:hypothetical protein
LDTETPIIRRTFAKYGTIVDLRTRTRGLYQQAFIRYDSPTAVQPFYDDTWDVLIFRDAVRVIPLLLSEEKRILRKSYAIKLAGFPRGTTAHDLCQILQEVNAKSCFIPRAMNNYSLSCYAYINFVSEEAVFNAASKSFQYEGQELFWVSTDTPTCHACGHPDHMVALCPNKPNRTMTPKQQQLNKLYDRYRPAQHRKPARSYADVAKPTRSVAQSLSQDERTGIVSALKDIRSTLTDMNDKINSLTNRIEVLETNYNNQPSAASPNKTPSKVSNKKSSTFSPPAKRPHIEVSSSSSAKESEVDFQSQLKSLQEENKSQSHIVASLRSQLDTITALLQNKIDTQGYRTEEADTLME